MTELATELATVKATVKAWQRAFRAKHSRDPTKQEIISDPGDIAEQYALYRRLSKLSAQESQSQPTQSHSREHSTQRAKHDSPQRNGARSGGSTHTNANSHHELPQTPTSRKHKATHKETARAAHHEAGSSSHVKRSASSAELAVVQNGAALSTPKRQKASTRAMHDPLSSTLTASRPKQGDTTPPSPNPFSVKASKPKASLDAASPFVHSSSPFIHASSPSKLRAVLEASSSSKPRASLDAASPFVAASPFIHASSPSKLRAVLEASSSSRTRPSDITPRTRARKRLAGEAVDDSPLKSTRRRRVGHSSSTPAVSSDSPFGFARPTASGDMHEDESFEDEDEREEEDEDEDELGETPIKGDSAFTILTPGARKGRHAGTVEKPGKTDLFPIFQRASVASSSKVKASVPARETKAKPKPKAVTGKVAKTGPSHAVEDRPSPFEAVPNSDEDSVLPISTSVQDHPLSSPSPPIAVLQSPSAPSVSRPRERQHVLSLSDDEVDEWDPEGSTRKTQVRIVGTRRAVVWSRRFEDYYEDEGGEASLDVGMGIEEDDEGTKEERGDEVDEGREEDDGDGGREGDETNAGDEGIEDKEANGTKDSEENDPKTPRTLLSLLSLRSPAARRGERLADLRVRALLDPTSAAATLLRAQERGQDVYGAGQGVGVGGGWTGEEEEDDLLDGWEAQEGEGDDDWESDAEGWKADPKDEAW